MANNDEITLQPKNGKKHEFFMRVAKTSWTGTLEELATREVEKITNAMQDKGYEIIDIKVTTVSAMYMSVLIIYQ